MLTVISFTVSKDSSIQITIAIKQSHVSRSDKNIVYKTEAMINCDATNANYISTDFVKEMRVLFLKKYFSKIVSIDEKKLISATYNFLYVIEFSTNENTSSIHIFRAINMKTRVILNLSWLQSINSMIDWKIKIVTISNNIEVLQSTEYLTQCEENQKSYVCFSKIEISEQMLKYLKLSLISVKISHEFQEYKNVFNEIEINELSSHRNLLNHSIDLFFDKVSFFESIYNLSENELTMLKFYINQNFVNKFIVRFKFSTNALILFIKKRDEKLKLCVDYRDLNVIFIKNKYFISLVTNILKRLKKIKIFTKLNIRKIYNFIRIKANDEWKTAFRTKYDNFEYKILSFELITESVTFQFYIDRALTDCLNKFCICYLNDILIYSDNVSDHNNHVKKILKTLRKHKLFVKLKKCSFSRNWVEYLKFIINTKSIIMNSAKTETILSWLISKFIKNIQSFLKFCNFYKRFIHEYSEIVLSLINAIKLIKFLWTKNIQKSFDLLKKAFIKNVLLKHFDSDRRTRVNTNASEFALTIIILQLQDNDQWHSIAFHSRKLKEFERNYVIHDQELLTIVDAFKIWKHYLKKAKYEIMILCDHNNLKYFMTSKSLIRRQAHWTEFLISFDFKIQHRAEKKNSADESFRRSNYKTKKEIILILLLKLISMTLQEAREATIDMCHELTLCENDEAIIKKKMRKQCCQTRKKSRIWTKIRNLRFRYWKK